MIGIEIIKYSIKNLWKRKMRSFLTILSIFVGIATIFIFLSFGLGLYNYIEEFTSGSSVDKVIVQARGIGVPGLDDTFHLTEDELEIVENTPGVSEADGAMFKIAEIKQKQTRKFAFIVAFDPKKPLMIEVSNIGIEKGRELKRGDTGKVVLGYNYMFENKIFPKKLDLNDKIEIQGKDAKIIGFYEAVGNPPDDSNIYVTPDYLDELYPDEENNFGMIIARVDVRNIDKTIERIEKNIREHRNLEEGKEDFFVQSFQDMIDSFGNVLNVLIGFVILIALISVFVSAINTANTMITSVLERVKEIGVMKAIGAKNSQVFHIFLLESLILGFVAGVIGVVIGATFTFLAGLVLEALGWGFLSPYFSPYLFIGCILFATITGGVSGAFPAYRASKTIIVEALRYE